MLYLTLSAFIAFGQGLIFLLMVLQERRVDPDITLLIGLIVKHEIRRTIGIFNNSYDAVCSCID